MLPTTSWNRSVERRNRRDNWLRGLHNRVYIISVHNQQIFTKCRKSIEIQGFLSYSNKVGIRKVGRNNLFYINCDSAGRQTQDVVFREIDV